jgi:hypothetical protein
MLALMWKTFQGTPHRVMVSVLTSSVIDHGFEPQSSQTKDKNKVFVASPLSTQH